MSLDLALLYRQHVADGNNRLALRVLHEACGIEYDDYELDRQGGHPPCGPHDGAPLFDLGREGIYPEDLYGPDGARLYSTGSDSLDRLAYELITAFAARPNDQLVVYRAVSAGDPPTAIRPGDWVTPFHFYAVEHGTSNLGGRFRILTALVHARDVFASGDSWLEWGYHPQMPMPDLPARLDTPLNELVARFRRGDPSTGHTMTHLVKPALLLTGSRVFKDRSFTSRAEAEHARAQRGDKSTIEELVFARDAEAMIMELQSTIDDLRDELSRRDALTQELRAGSERPRGQ